MTLIQQPALVDRQKRGGQIEIEQESDEVRPLVG